MSTLKLKGSSSWDVQVTVPGTVANQTITFPAAAPAAGNSLKATDTSGTLEWGDIALGPGNDAIFWVNGKTITDDYTIPTGKNAGTFGPVTIVDGKTVTVGANETWTVV